MVYRIVPNFIGFSPHVNQMFSFSFHILIDLFSFVALSSSFCCNNNNNNNNNNNTEFISAIMPLGGYYRLTRLAENH